MMNERIERLLDGLIEAACTVWANSLDEGDCVIDVIRGKVGKPALYENLAEEAAEVSHAALKVSRILRGENPTPQKIDDAMKRLVHEICDLRVVSDVIGIEYDFGYMIEKVDRWIKRLEEK